MTIDVTRAMDRISQGSMRMDIKSQRKPKGVKETDFIVKVADSSKYNLRCNRNISEKMTKKDFVYDMHRPLQGSKKLAMRQALNFECNFCHEPIATLFSLSTHVKYHCQKYCKQCYWILEDGETMDKHLEEAHKLGRKLQ